MVSLTSSEKSTETTTREFKRVCKRILRRCVTFDRVRLFVFDELSPRCVFIRQVAMATSNRANASAVSIASSRLGYGV